MFVCVYIKHFGWLLASALLSSVCGDQASLLRCVSLLLSGPFLGLVCTQRDPTVEAVGQQVLTVALAKRPLWSKHPLVGQQSVPVSLTFLCIYVVFFIDFSLKLKGIIYKQRKIFKGHKNWIFDKLMTYHSK